MATIKLYDDTPYETTFEATVISCTKTKDDNYAVILNRTLFFPEEGGQTPDTGILRSKDEPDSAPGNITDVQIDKDNTITHYSDMPFAEGKVVTGEIEWMHRYTNMQCHTGEHIISGIVHRIFGYDNIGFHLSDHIVTMDYNGSLGEDDIKEIEWLANEAVVNNIPVQCSYPDCDTVRALPYRSKKALEGAIRIVEIPGVDICACCAPHVRSTGEVGIIKILSLESYKGGSRLSILCGFRALEDYGEKHALLTRIGQILSANRDTILDALKAKDDEIFALKGQLISLGEKMLDKEASTLPENEKNPMIFTEGLPVNTLRNRVNKLTEEHPGYACIFNGNDSTGYSYIIGSKTLDCRELLTALKEHFDIKGGGSREMVQGHLLGKSTDIKNIIRNLYS